MVGDKVQGFGWFLGIWLIALLLLFLVTGLLLGCVPPVEVENPEKGAICMTAEMLQQTMDAACAEGYANGYAKAMAEHPQDADIELSLITRDELYTFLKTDPCDRCMSDVYDTANSCLARAECLLSSARSHGWDSYGVVINFEGADGGAHALVAFPLKDGTLVFVEPWYDTLEVVEVGKPYRPAHKIIEEMGILK
jgi:hypothetical protein